MINCKCGEKQYLVYNESGILTCLACGAEDTGPGAGPEGDGIVFENWKAFEASLRMAFFKSLPATNDKCACKCGEKYKERITDTSLLGKFNELYEGHAKHNDIVFDIYEFLVDNLELAIPKKIRERSHEYEYSKGRDAGWNQCVDKITRLLYGKKAKMDQNKTE
jgi:hypothetical protein